MRQRLYRRETYSNGSINVDNGFVWSYVYHNETHEQACTTDALCPGPPIDCVTAVVGNWTACTAECGGGTQAALLEVVTSPLSGGGACPDPLVTVRECNLDACSSSSGLSTGAIAGISAASGAVALTGVALAAKWSLSGRSSSWIVA